MSAEETTPTEDKNMTEIASNSETESAQTDEDSAVVSSTKDEENPVPRKRGRPRKHPLPDPNQPKRPRGRPRKENPSPEVTTASESGDLEIIEEKPARKRGRPPKKQPTETESPKDDSLSETDDTEPESPSDEQVKRKRGRPPKKTVSDDTDTTKPAKKQPTKVPEIPIEEFPIEIEPNMPKDRLNFYSLNVGLGNLMIMTLGTKAVIFDAGSMEKIKIGLSKFDILPEYIDPAISILKGKEIIAVIITHPHKDHYNLLIRIIQKSGHRPREMKFICGGSRDQYSDSTTMYFNNDNSIFSLDPTNIDKEVAPFTRDEKFVSDMKEKIELILNTGFSESGVNFEVFLPRQISGNIKDRANIHITSMIMFKVTYQTRSILLTGDATTQAVTNLGYPKSANPFGDFDIYCVPHHGSNNNSRHGVFCKVVPKLLLCSADATRYRCWENGLPRLSLIKSLQDDIPETAPEHTIRYWDNWHSASVFEHKAAPPPFEMRTKLPFFTTGDSTFVYREKIYTGLHVRIDPVEGQDRGTALLEYVVEDNLQMISIDDYSVVKSEPI